MYRRSVDEDGFIVPQNLTNPLIGSEYIDRAGPLKNQLLKVKNEKVMAILVTPRWLDFSCMASGSGGCYGGQSTV